MVFIKIKNLAIKRKYAVIITVLLILTVGIILIKLPLKYSPLSKGVKTTIKNVVNDVKKFINSNTRSIARDEIVLTFFNNKIEIYNLLKDNNLLLMKFDKKPWGTWNIEGWFISNDGLLPSKDTSLMVGGGSDWEYVFRVRTSTEKDYEFSGGNHGNEVLKAFKLMNPSDDSIISLEEGKKIKLKQLRIVEETFLTTNNNQTSKYAEVTRIYTIQPLKISLETDFIFTSDIYIGTSYVCMLPTTKEYGRYALFEDTGKLYTTPPVGETLTNGKNENYLGKEETTSVKIWGDANPSYKFIVSIKDSDMVNNFRNSLKTFYWDVNKVGNKLYFSKYDDKDNIKVFKGTKWSNYAEWSINIEN